jgi:hypothetical protein
MSEPPHAAHSQRKDGKSAQAKADENDIEHCESSLPDA